MPEIIEQYYAPLLKGHGFIPDPDNQQYGSLGISWKLSPEIGEGSYWTYGQKDLYDIKIHNFTFHEDSLLEFSLPECLSITRYDSISGEELVEAFRKIDQTTDFPEMSRLLTELQNYRGDGIAAKLFYEGKVAEALSLVVEYQKKRPAATGRLATQDIENIQTVATYLSDHYAAEVPMERLTQIACMGTTKLKSTITEYIQQRRMSQAEYLLTNTDLSIGQIAQTVGYSTSSRFAELFRKSTGLLPGEFRKVGKK